MANTKFPVTDYRTISGNFWPLGLQNNDLNNDLNDDNDKKFCQKQVTSVMLNLTNILLLPENMQ